MIRGFYNARSGLIAHQDRMNLISNNIANVDTVGFKPMRTAFKDLIYQNLNRTEMGQGRQLYRNPVDADPLHVGHGVKINKNDILLSQGAPSPSGRDMDMALLSDNAFFAVQTRGGEIRYTRNGNFSWNNDDGNWYIVNGNGERLLDSDWQPLEAQPDENGNLPTFNITGELVFFEEVTENINTPGLAPGQEQPTRTRIEENVVAELGVFRFSNPFALWSQEGTTFFPTPESGPAILIEGDPPILKGYLENSSVYIGQEMINMIEAQRAFSFNSRMIQTADEIEQTVNSLR